MTGLAERLQWILENGVNKKGKPWSKRGLSRAAGLADSHVGLLMRELRPQVSSKTIAQIATAAEVDANWLATGVGEPRPTAVPDPYAERALAAVLARRAGIHEDAIRAVLAQDVPPDRADWVALWWADEMRHLDEMRRRKLAVLEERAGAGGHDAARPEAKMDEGPARRSSIKRKASGN